jgi:hypothetical protein
MTIQSSSDRRAIRAPIANANGIVSPTNPRYSIGGWASMYGFWRLGLSPSPSAGAGCVANGLETATSRKEKKTVTAPSTGTVHASRLRADRRPSRTAAAEKPVRIRSQSKSDPSWPPQKAEIV